MMTSSATPIASAAEAHLALLCSFKNQVVRDLFWVFRSPNLLNPTQEVVKTFPDSWVDELFDSTTSSSSSSSSSKNEAISSLQMLLQSSGTSTSSFSSTNTSTSPPSKTLLWLRKLDNDPSHLISFLLKEENFVRLGYYFSLLIEYWFCFNPNFGGGDQRQTCLARQEFGKDKIMPRFVVPRNVSNNVSSNTRSESTRNGANNVATPSLASIQNSPLHVEAAIHCTIAPREADEKEVLVARYVGAFLYESLAWRLLQYRRNMRLPADCVEGVMDAFRKVRRGPGVQIEKTRGAFHSLDNYAL
jgi:hypothetical protein